MGLAIFRVSNARVRDGRLCHPHKDQILSDDVDDPSTFLFEVEDASEDKTLASFRMDRACMEQIRDNIELALDGDYPKIKKCP